LQPNANKPIERGADMHSANWSHAISNIALSAAAAIGIAAFAAAPSFAADPARVVAGTLTCKSNGAVGLVVGSKERMECKFQPVGGLPPVYLDGTATRIGLDVGVRGPSVLIWSVLGSTTQLRGEDLGGKFAGVTADVAAGIGLGANVLVGGNKKSIALQPVSVKGNTGLNLAVGVGTLSLNPR